MPLTDTTIRNTKPREKPYKLADEKGLFLLIIAARFSATLSPPVVLDNHTVYHALWAVDDYLADMEELLFKQSA